MQAIDFINVPQYLLLFLSGHEGSYFLTLWCWLLPRHWIQSWKHMWKLPASPLGRRTTLLGLNPPTSHPCLVPGCLWSLGFSSGPPGACGAGRKSVLILRPPGDFGIFCFPFLPSWVWFRARSSLEHASFSTWDSVSAVLKAYSEVTTLNCFYSIFLSIQPLPWSPGSSASLDFRPSLLFIHGLLDKYLPQTNLELPGVCQFCWPSLSR